MCVHVDPCRNPHGLLLCLRQSTTEVRRAQDEADAQAQVDKWSSTIRSNGNGPEDAFSLEIVRFISEAVGSSDAHRKLGAIAGIGKPNRYHVCHIADIFLQRCGVHT